MKQENWQELIPPRTKKPSANKMVLEMKDYQDEVAWVRSKSKELNTDMTKLVVALIRKAMREDK